MDYLRYLLPFVVMSLTALGLALGGPWTWLGIGLFVLMAIPDALMDFDYAARRMKPAGALFMAWIQLIPFAAIWVCFWLFLAGPYDALSLSGAVISTAVISAACGLPVGHELFHRAEGVSRFAGALITNVMLCNYVELEHNRGHHIETSSVLDVDTPRRGEALYPFMWRLLVYFHVGAIHQEKRRLSAYGESVWLSPRSRVLWSLGGAAVMIAAFYAADGWRSALIAALTGTMGACTMTVFSYVQHYGLVRLPGTPIQKRHAWNHPRPLSRALTFEIVTHSQHHIDPTTSYWDLPVYRDAPLVGSAIAYFWMALLPPLWHRVMRRHLARWDERFASPAERRLAYEANVAAGWA